jgi:hypothetical protein
MTRSLAGIAIPKNIPFGGQPGPTGPTPAELECCRYNLRMAANHLTEAWAMLPDSRSNRRRRILKLLKATEAEWLALVVPRKVVSKYFEDDFKDRVSTADILARQFGASVSATRAVQKTKHLQVTSAASNDIARPGLRIALSLEIELKPDMHVYAPGVQGYIPIDWQLEDSGPATKRHAFKYPPSEMLRLEAIGETVPVYRGHIRIVREITFGQQGALKPLVTANGELIVKGSFRYQACDDRKCYVPQDVPLKWHFKYEGLDRQRAPTEF